MKLKTRQTTISLLLASLFAPNIFASTALERISPFPSVPLSLQPQTTGRPKPNILVFLDNSYDGSRTADAKNTVPSPLALKNPETAAKTKLGVSKSVVIDLATKYPQYRWGVAAYAPAQLGTYLSRIPTCYEDGRWRNVDQEGCTFGNFAGPSGPKSINIASMLYFHDAGSVIYAPVASRDSGSINTFTQQVNNIPIWGQGAGTHSSPITSAYYEMTRYFRGMRSAYERAGDYKVKVNGEEVPTIAQGAFAQKGISKDNSAWQHDDKYDYKDALGRDIPVQTQYVSPIQYRCQSNNIIMISSAADIRISFQSKIKQAFYEAYYSDPVFRHDNPKYAYLLDNNSGTTEQYNNETYQTQDPSHYFRLMYNDTVSGLPAGDTALAGTPLYKVQAAVRSYYNEQYNAKSEAGGSTNTIPLGFGYVRQVNDGRYNNDKIEDLRNVVGFYSKGPLQQNPVLSQKSILNPYMDTIEHLYPGQISNNRIKAYNSNVKFDPSYGIGNVITRNAYNEDTGIDAFAHLAYGGDIITKGSDYKYPVFNFPNGVNYNDATISNVQDQLYASCGDKKCIYNKDTGSPSTLDDEGKPWDGSADKVVKNATGEVIDYSERFGHQHIHTYTIGFGITPPAVNTFPELTITGLGTGKNIYSDQEVKFDYSAYSDTLPIHIGDYIFYKGKMLAGSNGDPVKTTTGYMPVLKQAWMSALPYNVCFFPESNTAYGLDKNGINKLLDENNNVCTSLGGTIEPIRASGSNDIEPGLKIRIIPEEVAQRLINPQPAADQLLQYAAEKGGGAYFSLNTQNSISPEDSKKDLEKTLEHILSLIDTALVALPVGSTVATNDVNNVNSAITTILDSDRWSSELRFYTFDKDGKFDPTNYSTPHYIKPNFASGSNYMQNRAFTVINTPDGIRSLNINGFGKVPVKGTNVSQLSALIDDTENGVTLNNKVFNIGHDINHEPVGGLKIAVSTRPFEWKNLVAWLTRATDSDRNDAFKTSIFGVDQYIYRDRDPNNLTDKYPGKFYPREMGDVMDSNILLMSSINGNDYQSQQVKPYLAVGANDGMLHIYNAIKDVSKLNGYNLPYAPIFNYIPGAAKRNTDDDTLIKNLVYTAEKGYGMQANPHEYFLNGQLFYLKTFSGETRHLKTPNNNGQLMLTGTLGQGGRAAYSLNIGGTAYGSTVDPSSNSTQILPGTLVGLDAPRNQWVHSVPLWDSSRLWDSNSLYSMVNGIRVKSKSCDDFGNGQAECKMDRDLGYTIGTAQVARVTVEATQQRDPITKKVTVTPVDARYATFLSSGFDTPSQSAVPTLYIIDQLGRNVQKDHPNLKADRKAGSLIKAIPVCTPPKVSYGIAPGGNNFGPKGTKYMSDIQNSQDCISKNVALRSGLASPQALDIDGDGVIDLVYAGDQNGNMWRFDLRGGVNKWTVHQIYKGVAASGLPPAQPHNAWQPITAAPAIYHNYDENDAIIIFGTGSELYKKDQKDKSLQSLYGIYDHVNSCNPTSDDPTLHQNDPTHCRTLVKTDLVQQNIIKQQLGKVTVDGNSHYPEDLTYRIISNKLLPKENPTGWTLDLAYNNQLKGERVIYQPAVLKNSRNTAGVFFSSHVLDDVPPSQRISCTPKPIDIRSWSIALDAKTGGNPGKWLNLNRTIDGKSIASYMISGRLSAIVFPNINNVAIGYNGEAQSGVETRDPPPKKLVNPCTDGKTITGLASVTSGGSGSIIKVNVKCGTTGLSIHRLSWRELF